MFIGCKLAVVEKDCAYVRMIGRYIVLHSNDMYNVMPQPNVVMITSANACTVCGKLVSRSHADLAT